jgi:hypothetical protein
MWLVEVERSGEHEGHRIFQCKVCRATARVVQPLIAIAIKTITALESTPTSATTLVNKKSRAARSKSDAA